MKTSLLRQRGMSAPAAILLLLVAVAAGTFAIKTVPAYLDFNTIDGAINSVLADGKLGLKSTAEIRDDIGKRLNINNVEVITKHQIRIEKDAGRVLVGVDYKVQEDLVHNIDLVMHFQKEYEKSVR
jgi:hypothetical protein